MMSEVSLDWPLSKEEQKKRIMRLYDKDVQAANELLHSGEAALKVALKALHQKLKDSQGEGSTASQDTPCPEQRDPGGRMATGREAVTSIRSEPEEPRTPTSPAFTEQTEQTEEAAEETAEDGENAAEAAARLQNAIVDAAAALASLFGTSSLSSVLVGIAADADKDSPEECSEVRQRAKSEGARVIAPAIQKPEDRRRRKSRGGEPLKVSFADEEEMEEHWPGRSSSRRRPSIGEPEPSPPSSPKAKQAPKAPPAGPAALSQALQGQSRACVPRRQRRGRAPPTPSSAPAGMLDFI
ncbi:unnamed protein product [Symbiodinium sp. CCMP2456]|nr:unnamed protein product [Symbiodinium sp. CCMP2456]